MGGDFASPTAFSMRIFFRHCVNEADDCAAFFGGKAGEFLQERDIFRILTCAMPTSMNVSDAVL